MRFLLKAINVLVTVLLVGIIVLAGGLTLSAKASKDQIPTILGYKVLSVLSGSMEPTIGTGDVIVAKPYAGEPIKEGDIVTFRAVDQQTGKESILITHRVVGIVAVNGKPAAYVTKGDANDSKDLTPISVSQVFATYRWRVPFLGYISAFIRTPVGILLLLILPGLLFIGGEVVKIYKTLKEADAADKKAVEPELVDGHPGSE
jgi:signal peptidase